MTPGTLTRDKRSWPERREAALKNRVLRQNVGRVTRRVAAARVRAYAEYEPGRLMREQARGVKRRALATLPEVLMRAVRRLQSNGATVVELSGPEDVARYLTDLAKRRGASLVVKSKSMMTEELNLNHRLEVEGLTVRETDLGEYIIQLLGERPSHILAPAAHRNRAEVQELFERTADAAGVERPASDDPAVLTQFARQRLREEFLSADIGITGANFVVAETGTVVLITNEGNADMVTSLPPVHVVVVGIEKVVDTWEDLVPLIQQPALSGVGQRLSGYTTLISGPRPHDHPEGPEELHVLFVDNGRRTILGGPYEDVLTCIRCGACYNVCPVYRQVGGHAYGSTYAGPIGAVETPLLAGLQLLPELPRSLCTLCNACLEACPMGIELPDHLITLRRDEVEAHMERGTTRFTYRWWGRWWSSPRRYRAFVAMAKRAQRVYVRGGRLTAMVGLPGGWFKTRDMPPIAAETFHEWWDRHRGPERHE